MTTRPNYAAQIAEAHLEAYDLRQRASRTYVNSPQSRAEAESYAVRQMRRANDQEARGGMAAVVYAMGAVLLVGVLVALFLVAPLLR